MFQPFCFFLVMLALFLVFLFCFVFLFLFFFLVLLSVSEERLLSLQIWCFFELCWLKG